MTKHVSGLNLIIITLTTLIIAGCSDTPNSIIISPNRNQCVQSDMYSSSVTPLPQIANNPQTAPYCMSISIQNNNSGLNANNIQITNGGLTMSYTVGATTYNSQMYDPAAAGITIGGANQILGNIAVFDPQNCLTNSGANVITLNSGGAVCTFYMQILLESNPVGVYPTNMTYNYTNGNQNYSITASVNQRVNLFAGGTTGLFVDNTGSWTASTSLPVPIQVPTAVTSLARDIYGNIYITTSSVVYQFNGIATNQLTNTLPGILINGVTTDINGSVYIATTKGIFKYSFSESKPAWLPYDDLSSPAQIGPNTNVLNIRSYENFESYNVLYATTENQAYICNTQSDLNGVLGCHWTLLSTGVTPPTIFLSNAIALDLYNNLYSANESSVNTFSSNQWSPFPYFTANTTGTLDTVFWTLFSNTQFLYVGENNPRYATESTVYMCNMLTATCGGLQSKNNNSLTGNVYAVAADGANNVYAVGNRLNSADFSSSTTNVFGAFLTAGLTEFIATTPWTPISNGSPPVITGGSLTVLKVSSMLTSY